MIEELEMLARVAGKAILEVYRQSGFRVETKEDQSPLTEADLRAHRIIIDGLKTIEDLPYISEEESPRVYPEPPHRYWLVDPLDGTKEFVARRDTFTVNIALIERGTPTVAVVYAPALDELYSSDNGVYRENGRMAEVGPLTSRRLLLSSRSHPEDGLEAFLKAYGITEHERVGSSIKFCWVASGRAQFYPRFGSLHAWDTAAGDGVARAAGCSIIDWTTGKPPRYAYDQPYTQGFCLIGRGVDLEPSPVVRP